ncbi:hypothetical protein BT69DRAFT_1308121 [Atractiella rhizophila]|nr:hypothetical protein BT69DRAFT_1308121 [Atractiella rhizophila]
MGLPPKTLEITFDESSSLINVTLFEKDVPLALQYEYKPETAYATIHESFSSRNQKIKEHYWKIWGLGSDDELTRMMGQMDGEGVFEGEKVKIERLEVEEFCRVVGNGNERYRGGKEVPMDYAIKLGWKSIMKTIFPGLIDGDITRLVHLSNGFRRLSSQPSHALRIGSVASSSSRIQSITNSPSGKTVHCVGTVYLELPPSSKGKEHSDRVPVLEVESEFFIRGSFSDYARTFKRVEDPKYSVLISTKPELAVLNSKQWFTWLDPSQPLKEGSKLTFRTSSSYVYADSSSYSRVEVKGEATIVGPDGRDDVVVARIEYEEEGRSKGNPVLDYLKRKGEELEKPVLFEGGGYTLTKEGQCVGASPASNEDYSRISGDWNPIHCNPLFASLAGLPGTITHGMANSASTRAWIERVAAEGDPSRVVSYNVSFLSMCLPSTPLSTTLKHIGQIHGRQIISVVTQNQETGEKLLEGQAEVEQPPTAYVFTGQGSQEVGMGMALYAESEVARSVWDEADRHLGEVYGFSIIDIVRNNPKEKTIHFGGLKGQAIRQRYMEMSYTTTDKEGNVRTLPLFGDISLRTSRYTFSSPTGLLYATQFAQIALTITEKASFEDMRAKGLVQQNCPFAGHSLGEYSALANIVFYRGITMQRAVERDHLNRSNYAMCAVNPSRVGPSFTDYALREVVDTISSRCDVLVQIVNLNVAGQQYVVAGELLGLQTLTNVLNLLKFQKIDLQKLLKTMSVEEVKEKLGEIIDGCFEAAKELKVKQGGYLTLERGIATIPLPGIDVPFHSRYLWAGVLPFRTHLAKKVNPERVDFDLLIGKYVPNLIAEPFEITKEYAVKIYDQTNSPRIEKVLKKWDAENWGSAEMKSKLGYIILIECLSYQFASPVRWIETQDLLFKNYNFERMIEIGPSPTLAGMAQRTLKALYEKKDQAINKVRSIYCVAKHTKEIYYQFEDEVEEAPAPGAPETADAAPAPAAAPTPVAAPAPVAAAGPTAEVPDEPIKAVDVVRVVIAQKLKKGVSEISLSKNIKEFVNGKSTFRSNEILGDLGAEFGAAPEKAEELPLDEMGAALSVGYNGQLGKHTNGLISRLINSKMPGGFGMSSVRGYLSKKWGLATGRQDGALLIGLTMEPAKRLGSEGEAQGWLDSVAQAYGSSQGLSLSPGGGGGAAGGVGGAMIDNAAFEAFTASQHEFVARQIEVLMRYLKKDSREGFTLAAAGKVEMDILQDRLDAVSREHGDEYVNGIQPIFTPLKARHFDSSWNWVLQDAMTMFFDIIFGKLTTVDRDVTARCLVILNRVDSKLLDVMEYYVKNKTPIERGETYRLARQFGQQLLDNCRENLGQPPLYRDVTFPTAPKTTITAKGDIVVEEVNREGVSRLEKYVAEMAAGIEAPPSVNLEKVQEQIQNLYRLVKAQPTISKTHMNSIRSLYGEVVRSLQTPATAPQGRGRSPARNRRPSNQFLRPNSIDRPTAVAEDKIPLLHLKRKVGPNWQYSSKLTTLYLDVLKEIATAGVSFEHKNALLTGVGKGSIGVEILKGLLAGGAHVVVTTSRYSRATVEYYQSIFHECGSTGSSLTVVPFNQGSKQDVDALVDYIYSHDKGLGMDLDYICPFAALPENGREIDGLDDRSELAHRIMLTNLLRLMGAVKAKKAAAGLVTRPTQVVLPLSPNHGLFGNDGLYSESKISLETLFSRWSSESWGEYLCVSGAVIGWTRGTGLMGPTAQISEGVESYGCRTFSAKEMAFNILGLMHPLLFDVAQIEPVWADLNGGMDKLSDLAAITTKIRTDIQMTATIRKAIAMDNSADFKTVNGVEAEAIHHDVTVLPRANFQLPWPELKNIRDLEELSKLRGLIDLDKVIVVAGYAEVGPWGSSRTRWEMEKDGQLSIEGTLELAYVTGLIKHLDGRLKDGKAYVGWVDAKSGEPVDDKDVRSKYEKHILDHSGIRLIEPEINRGYDPLKKGWLQEIELNHDLEPIETSAEDAEKFKLQHGDKVDIYVEGERFFAKLKKGAKIVVPKASKFDRLVAGQIPTGWNPKAFGIPDDIAAQTDRATLWALVAVSEALLMAGVTDPYEFYKYVHTTELGTCLGSGMGGMTSMQKMFKDRREEADVQNDVLQETFINTTAGWVNLLLLSSSGPVKIPVGACATALQSMEIACDTILSGKAKVMVAGGFDDFCFLQEEGSYEFAQMKATSNAVTEFAAGREPTEFSRPTTSTRAGFMESQGCGVQIVMSASTAIKMGCTIHGVVAYTATATDKAGRSIPAPGKGVLGSAREAPAKYSSQILQLSYRRRQLEFRRRQIGEWLNHETSLLKDEISVAESEVDREYIAQKMADIETEAKRQESEALAVYGMLEGYDTSISPLRRALAVWDLTMDDIGVASFHGTSTAANDKNESAAHNLQMKHLGRTPGNICPVIAQKWLTGHPKGGAASWQMNGLLQVLKEGVIPGNRNADNISKEMRQFEFLVYPSKTVKTDGLKAGLLTSFGFGQVGGITAFIHPDHLLATLQPEAYEEYKSKRGVRARLAYRQFNDMFTKGNLVKIKDAPPFGDDLETPVLLNPLVRVTKDAKGDLTFPKTVPSHKVAEAGEDLVQNLQLKEDGANGVYGIGTDVELVTAVPADNQVFLERNFTQGELEYCKSAPDRQASLAARWAAKEAVFKSLKTSSKGAGAAMKDIEIVHSSTGPTVRLHGDAAKVANEKGIKEVQVSLSHAETTVLAFAIAKRG